MDHIKRNRVLEVVRDAEMLSRLVRGGKKVGEEMAIKMRRHYSDVALPTKDVPSAGHYSNLVTLAGLGEEIGADEVERIEQFGAEAEKYMALV